MSKDYLSKDYNEPEDLLTDESFLSWYLGPGREADRFWVDWASGNPDRKVLLDQATTLLDGMRLREKSVTEDKVERATAALLERIGKTEIGEPGVVRGAFRRRIWMAAACVLVLVTGGIAVGRLMGRGQQHLATAYGEVILQTLPDGSVVMMNANSRLRLSSRWEDGGDREVWLDGEAFFRVKKTPGRRRFVVHAGRFDVIVTGTQFNVVNRGAKDNVLLREGSVIVHPLEGVDVAMVPGEFVQWGGNGLEKGGVKSDSLLAWQQHQLQFDKTPLKDVVGIIKDQYGVQIELEDSSIGDSTISGIVRNDNLDVFLQALETTSDYEVIRKEGKIAIRASAR